MNMEINNIDSHELQNSYCTMFQSINQSIENVKSGYPVYVRVVVVILFCYVNESMSLWIGFDFKHCLK